MYKKISLPCSEKRRRKAFADYVKCENEVRSWNDNISEDVLHRFQSVSSSIWGEDLSLVDRKIYEISHIPKHGPGATADKISGNRKFNIREWTTRLEDYFPSAEFVVPNFGFVDELNTVDFIEPEAEIPVRVITVPKTLKTPRIIAIEPLCMQYAQQSLLEIIVESLEKSKLLQGSIGFTLQEPNQFLAKKGSIDGKLATIDLSEASDRVSNLLVKRMLHNFPTLSGAVQACRSLRADVPGEGIHTLSKFASMGSALCFPIEAMVFLTIIAISESDRLKRQLRRKDLSDLFSRVRVYGDDIIVPVDLVPYVTHNLVLYGLKVNERKSFWTGKFRESCGKDYYDGEDVSVTYLRRKFPSSRSDASEMISTVAFRNLLYKAGLWNTVRYLDSVIERLAPFPNVAETSPVLGRNSVLGYTEERICEKLHRPLVKGLIVRVKHRKSFLDGPGALLKFFLKRGPEPLFDVKHLERHGRPESVDIKIGWSYSY